MAAGWFRPSWPSVSSLQTLRLFSPPPPKIHNYLRKSLHRWFSSFPALCFGHQRKSTTRSYDFHAFDDFQHNQPCTRIRLRCFCFGVSDSGEYMIPIPVSYSFHLRRDRWDRCAVVVSPIFTTIYPLYYMPSTLPFIRLRTSLGTAWDVLRHRECCCVVLLLYGHQNELHPGWFIEQGTGGILNL